MAKRLYRSKKERMIAGVCGGVADYFNIDPVVARIIFVVLGLGWGGGFLLYLIMWIIVPEEPSGEKA
jgi:phage shock protein C